MASDPSRSDEYHKAKQEWEEYQNNKLKGAMLRSKAQWVEHGEKIVNFFSILKKKLQFKAYQKVNTGRKYNYRPCSYFGRTKKVL